MRPKVPRACPAPRPGSSGLSARSWAAAATVLTASIPSPSEAGGFHISILGVKRTSMGTTVAAPDDPTALFHNPAGLADQPGLHLLLSNGLSFLSNEAQLQALDPARYPEVNPANCGEPGNPACSNPIGADGYYEKNVSPESALGILPYLGVSHDLSFLSPDLRNIVVSLAAYAPGAYGASFADDAPTAYYILKGLFVIGAVTGGAGWKINDQISVGANLSFNYMRLNYAQKFSTIDILTPAGAEPDFTAGAAQLLLGDLRLDYTGEDTGIGWGFGVLVRPTDWMSVGASYGGFTAANFRGDLELRGLGSVNNGTAPTSPTELRTLVRDLDIKLPTELEVEMPIPPAFNLGVSFFPTSWLELGVEGKLWLYTIFERQVRRPIYDPNDPGEEPITEASLSSDKNYSNSWQIDVGAMVAPLDDPKLLELMFGVAFDKSPVPDETFSIDNPSLDQLSFAVGFRSHFHPNWRAGASYQYTHYLDRDVRTSQTSPPTNVRISGGSHIPTFEIEAMF